MNKKSASPSTLQRGLNLGYAFLNTLLPLSETRRIAKGIARPWFTLINRVQRWCSKKGHPQMSASLSWQEAVNLSGLTPHQLQSQYRTAKYLWYGVFIIPIIFLAVIIIMLLFNATTLPLIIWIKASLFLLMGMAISALGFMRALMCEYRLWQLREKRVCSQERGEFKAFLEETAWIKKTLKIT